MPKDFLTFITKKFNIKSLQDSNLLQNYAKAQQDARLRGINKIIRIATQIVIMNINNIFKIPYAQSILGAGVNTAICTILTDSISRTLSGIFYT